MAEEKKDLLRFLNGQEADLANKAIQRGQVYFAISSDTDSGKIYFDAPIDANTTKRILMSSDHAKTADKATEADRAIKDSNQKKITETYISLMRLDNAGTTIQYKYPDIETWYELKPKFLPLTGGTVTGELYVDSVTAGDLLVNGSARFVNTILGNIETANKWKTARGFQIADSDAAHTGVSVNVDGSGNVVLKLPSTIKASIVGHASLDLPLTGGTLSGPLSFSGDGANGAITWKSGTWWQRIVNVDDSVADTNVFEFQQSSDAGQTWTTLAAIKDNGKIVSNTFVGAVEGNASSSDKWNTARNFQVSDADAAHTGTAVSVDGSKAIVLPLPATIKAALQGNADSSTIARALGIDNTMKVYGQSNNEVNFGGTNKSSTIYFGYRAKDSKPIPSKFVFGGSTGTAEIVASKFTGALNGNATSADKLSTARKIAIADNGAAHTGTGVEFDGTKDITVQLPSVLNADITGNANTVDSYHAARGIGLYYKSSTVEFTSTNTVYVKITTDNHYYYDILKFYIDADYDNIRGATLATNFCRRANQWHIVKSQYNGSNILGVYQLDANTLTYYIALRGANSTGKCTIYSNANIVSTKVITSADADYNTIKNYNFITSVAGGISSSNIWAHLDPYADNTYHLGTSSLRWKTINATDLYGQLHGNVDGNAKSATTATQDVHGNAFVTTYLTDVYIKENTYDLYKSIGTGEDKTDSLIGTFAPLDPTTKKIAIDFLPASVIERVVVVADDTARKALTTATVQLGDVVKVNSTDQMYFVVNESKLNSDDGYLLFSAGTAANVNWSGILNRPNVVASATGNAIVPNAANTEFTVYQANGNGTSTSYVIKPNFLPKTGGTITGELYVDGGTTLASLLVNGDARFVNTIQGSISGNAGTADKWRTARNVYIADSDAAHTGTAVSVDGSKDVTLKLPSTIKGSLQGNADSATRAALLNELDLRLTNETPVWYMSNYPCSLKAEFKSTGAVSAINDGTGFQFVLTTTRWSDSSGGRPVQIAFDNKGIQFRPATNDTTWGTWKRLVPTDGTDATGNWAINAASSDKWSTARNIRVADNSAANSGAWVAVDGSAANYTLQLPETIKATLNGSADMVDDWHAKDFYNEYSGNKWHHIQMINTNTDRTGFYKIADIIMQSGYGTYTAAKIVGYLYDHNGNWKQSQTYTMPFQAIINITEDKAYLYSNVIADNNHIRIVKKDVRSYEVQVRSNMPHTDWDVFYQVVGAAGVTTYDDLQTGTTPVDDAHIIGITQMEDHGNHAYCANQWTTSRTFITALDSESSASVNGTANVTMGVSGTLPTSHGGTGNTSFTANRLVWTETATKMTAGYHYADSTHVGICYTSQPDKNFAVSGSVRFAIGDSDTSANKQFIIGSSGKRYLSFGGSGIQAYNASNTKSQLSLNYYGGTINIGSSSNYADTTMYGGLTVKGTTSADGKMGFNYEGIGAGSDNADRVVWFAYNGKKGIPVYDNDFVYNPFLNQLTVGKLLISETSSENYIKFARDSWDYILGGGTSAIISLNPNGTNGSANSVLAASTSAVYPGAQDSAITLGKTNSHWLSGFFDTLYISTDTSFDNRTDTVAGSYIGTGEIVINQTTTGSPALHLYNQTYNFGLLIGSGGTNRGLYDWTDNKWIFYYDNTHYILNGNSRVNGNLYFGSSNTTYYIDSSGTANLNALTVNGKAKIQNTTDSKNSQDSEASLAVQGGVSVAKQLSAKTVRIDGSSSDASGSTTQGCTVNFNKTTNCIEFVFD